MTARELPDRVGALLLEQTAHAVALLDHDRRILLANPAFVRAFGEPAGRSCHEALRQRSAPCVPCWLEDAFAGGPVPAGAEEQLLDRDGAARVCGVDAALLPGDEPGRVLLLARDVTALAALRDQLREAEQLATVGLTVAGLAHTIKNILLGLEGATYLVEAGLAKQDPERLQGGWAMVKRYLDQVSTLVKNLLSYARPRVLERQPLAPGDLARATADLFRDKAALAEVALEVQVAPALPLILGDQEALSACLANLVANALDACMWDPDQDKEHRIELDVAGGTAGRVALAVRDNGMGISPENQRKLLTAIFTTKGMRGTGLGLLLTRKAVEAHGGCVSFHSVAGVGTTFTIELPPAPAGGPGGEERTAPGGTDGGSHEQGPDHR